MKENEKIVQSVEAYRTPAFSGKALAKSILTLGFKKPKHLSEPALLYVFEYSSSEAVRLSTETMSGEREEVALLRVTQEDFREQVLEKQSVAFDGYIYHFDLDTILYKV
ncbi:hypothetical protein [Marinilactibacillus kalidii]|uniref:hypothetical protein n=1 Tax=Marinilactibacillus kalidii TaxID=2820274 RepID=UPI001ABED1B0|nr:hypothetical protein [Marinilactibacillus kalidii]